ncbi:hypothetical protein KAI56_04820 [Candidatus Parcubacteria bacterium]|nr:hypothetical protein [Candidatus Parcubacteria bacterium]
MRCKNCKNELSENTKFCGKCGQKIDTVTKVTSKKDESEEKKSPLVGVITIVIFIVAFVGFRYLTQEAISPSSNLNTQGGVSKSELIVDTVREIKSATALPIQLDEITMWNNVTAQPSAIRYHYTLSDVDINSLSNDYFKSYLGPILCENQDTRYLLDQGIDMEYSYLVRGSVQSYFVSFTKADCL